MTRKPQRHPAAGLSAVVALGLLAAFFAWQSAEPLWLALGRGENGTATVTRCTINEGGLTYPCVAFDAADGTFQVADVALRGAGDAAASTEGTSLPARMLAADRDQAYAASTAGLHLRWSLGLLLVLACGAGIAWASGATRLDGHWPRRGAVLLSFAGPLLLTGGFIVAAF